MRDDSISDPEKNIVAYAMYWKYEDGWKDDWRERWNGNVAEDMSVDKLSAFFDPMSRQHRVIMGERKHLCKFIFQGWGTEVLISDV